MGNRFYLKVQSFRINKSLIKKSWLQEWQIYQNSIAAKNINSDRDKSDAFVQISVPSFFGLFSVPSSDFETNVSLWHCWLRKLLRFRRQRWNNSGFFYSGSSMNKCNTASTRSGARTFGLTCIETIVSFKRVTPIVKSDRHSSGCIVYFDGWTIRTP